jgi:hypothetical protein
MAHNCSMVTIAIGARPLRDPQQTLQDLDPQQTSPDRQVDLPLPTVSLAR